MRIQLLHIQISENQFTLRSDVCTFDNAYTCWEYQRVPQTIASIFTRLAVSTGSILPADSTAFPGTSIPAGHSPSLLFCTLALFICTTAAESLCTSDGSSLSCR